MKYSYFKTNRKIICVATYAGRRYRGIAKCSPDDSFDEEVGKKLARMRCDLKTSEAKLKYSQTMFDLRRHELREAENAYDFAYDYLTNARAERAIVREELKNFLKTV